MNWIEWNQISSDRTGWICMSMPMTISIKCTQADESKMGGATI